MRHPARSAYGSRAGDHRDGGTGSLSAGSVAQRYRELRANVVRELETLGRDPAGVTIVGVSKKQPARIVAQAIEAGLGDVAENYLQEAREKLPLLPPPVRRHFIGHVQTNKAKAIAALFDVVQSVDRPDAAVALGKAAVAAGKELTVLLQLNVSPTERFGCPLGEADALAELIRSQPGLRLDGVMAIGPLDASRAAISEAFAEAAKTFGRIGGTTLSIGMSGDWPEALRAGSTMLRIGEALFGERV